MPEATHELLRLLENLGESFQFCTAGAVNPVIPGLEVEGLGEVGLPITAAAAKKLIAQAAQAPYGRGEETIVDPQVRRVWQIEPGRFSIRNPQWDALVDEIVRQVQIDLGVVQPVKAGLYKLLIYEKGSFFVSHRDTEKLEGMFGTLVVCLPSKHTGGELVVRHNGEERTIDFSGPQGEYQIQFAAFYADCPHEIKPVTNGYRVCLVYNLAIAGRKRQPAAPRSGEQAERAAGLLARLFAAPSRDKIAIPLVHEYTEAGLSLEGLKGADRARVEVLRRAAVQAGCQMHLALLTYWQVGDVDYDTVGYSRWGYQYDEDEVEMGEVLEEELSLNHWIDAEGRKAPLGKMSLEKEEILLEGGFDSFSIKQEVQEATGNEGVTVERWYRQAMIVLWPQDRMIRILAREGPDVAVPALKEMVAASSAPARDPACRAFSKEIIGHWKPRRPYSYYPAPRTREATGAAEMLELLERIADPELVRQFIREVLVRDYSGGEGKSLARLAAKMGWETLADELTYFVAQQAPQDRPASLKGTVAIFKDLCCARGGMTPERQRTCRAMAAELIEVVKKWDGGGLKRPWIAGYEDRKGVVESMVEALGAIEETRLLDEFVSHVLAGPRQYDLHEVLIPAVKNLHKTLDDRLPARDAMRRLAEHCIRELEARTAAPIEEPKDLAQDVTLKCRCADCRELEQFLRDPQERVHRFRRAENGRRHLHAQIDAHGLDVDHVTERTGRPYTLVCTKNRASYQRRKKQYATDTALLQELRRLTPVKGKRKG